MKKLIAMGLFAAGIMIVPVTQASAQYYYGGYYYPAYSYPAYSYGYNYYSPGYYSTPGLSINFSYSERDRYRRPSKKHYNRPPGYNRPYNRPVPHGPGRPTTY